MKIYQKDFQIEYKDDNSPLTICMIAEGIAVMKISMPMII
jgi:hypothetical protein